MADNVTADPGAGGATFASDDIGGVQYPRAKVVWGVDGAAVDASASNPLPTVQTGALPAGTNAIGKLAANSGVDIGDVDVTSVTPGTGATNLGKAEDSAHASGDVGVVALAIRKDTAASTADADGDYVPLSTDSVGQLRVAPSADVTASGTLGALNDAVTINTQGMSSLVGEIPAGLTGTYKIEVPDGNGGWNGQSFFSWDEGRLLSAKALLGQQDTLLAPTFGYPQMRIRVSSYTSGSVTATLRASAAAPITNGTSDFLAADGLDSSFLSGVLDPFGSARILRVAPHVWNGASYDRMGGVAARPLRIDPTGTTTQPVSAASLPLPSNAAQETGGNLAGAATSLAAMDDWDESDRAKVNPIVGQAGVQGNTGVVTATTQRVVLATDVALPAGTNAIGKLAANSGVDIGDVDVASIAAGDNNIGNVDVVTLPAIPAGNNNIGDVDIASIAAGTNYVGKVRLTDGTLDSSLVDETGSSAVDALAVGGGTPHGSADSGNPVKVGMKAANAFPTAEANADRVNALGDLFGRMMVTHIDPAQQVWKSYNDTSSRGAGSAQVVWDPTSGKKIAITHYTIAAYGTTAGRIFLFFADDADLTYTAGTDQPLFVGSYAPSSSSKPGTVLATGNTPIFCTTADRRLHYQNDAAISVDIVIYGYEW